MAVLILLLPLGLRSNRGAREAGGSLAHPDGVNHRSGASLAVAFAAVFLAGSVCWSASKGLSGQAGSASDAPTSEETTLLEAAVSLPVAAALGAALAFRPRRRGTPPRN